MKAWLAAEESGLPHLVEDPQAIIVRLQQNRAPAAVIRLPVDEDCLRPKSGVDHNGILANRASESVEIELAINELRRIIADKEGEAHVRGSATLDFLQRVD